MIDPIEPFCLQARCRVIYDGRAYSVLQTGVYLILHKADGSFQIHGQNLIKPLNYQGPKSVLTYHNNRLICLNKTEKLVVELDEIISYSPLNLSSHQIEIRRTERELVQKILQNWEQYFGKEFETIQTEFKVSDGTADIAGFSSSGDCIIIEVKRRKATVRDATQLQLYVESVESLYKVKGVLAAPQIAEKARTYLQNRGDRYSCLEIGFD